MPSRAIDPLSPLVSVSFFFTPTKCESVAMSTVLFAWIPGPMELLICLVIMLLLFGNRLPSLMRNLGASAREFKKGVQGMEEDMGEASKPLTTKDTEA
jgi:sec-independent protein translocase protein TatA